MRSLSAPLDSTLRDARATFTSATRVNVGVLVHDVQTFPAKPGSFCDSARRITPQPVLVCRNGFKVADIDTRWSFAQVVKNDVGGESTDEPFVGDAVRCARRSGYPNDGVSVLVDGQATNEAVGGEGAGYDLDSPHHPKCGRGRVAQIGTSTSGQLPGRAWRGEQLDLITGRLQ